MRELRADRGWTLAKLAELSGLHKAIVSQIERGRIVATPVELELLSDAIGMPLVTTSMVVHWEPA